MELAVSIKIVNSLQNREIVVVRNNKYTNSGNKNTRQKNTNNSLRIESVDDDRDDSDSGRDSEEIHALLAVKRSRYLLSTYFKPPTEPSDSSLTSALHVSYHYGSHIHVLEALTKFPLVN